MSAVTAIPLILSTIATLSQLYRDTVAAGRQNAEFTPEQEAAWQAQWEAIRKGPEWQLSTAGQRSTAGIGEIPPAPLTIDQRNVLSDSTL